MKFEIFYMDKNIINPSLVESMFNRGDVCLA